MRGTELHGTKIRILSLDSTALGVIWRGLRVVKSFDVRLARLIFYLSSFPIRHARPSSQSVPRTMGTWKRAGWTAPASESSVFGSLEQANDGRIDVSSNRPDHSFIALIGSGAAHRNEIFNRTDTS